MLLKRRHDDSLVEFDSCDAEDVPQGVVPLARVHQVLEGDGEVEGGGVVVVALEGAAD